MKRTGLHTTARRACGWIHLPILLLLFADASGRAAPIPQFNVPKIFREIWPIDTEAESELLESLGDDYQIHHTNHFSIAHSHLSLTTEYRGAIAESVYMSFISFFVENGFDLERPDVLQTVILLPTREEFVDRVGDPDLADQVEGIFVHASGRAYFFDALGRAEVRVADQANQEIESDLRKMRRKIARSEEGSMWTLKEKGRPSHRYSQPDALETIDRMLRTRKRGASKLRDRMGQGSVETMCHEIVHQLAQAMGVFSAGKRNPRWITEGIATFFEPSEHGYLLAHGAIHWARWDALQKAHQQGDRISLFDLLTRDELLLDMTGAARAYDESWSLVHFLAATNSQGLMDYLLALKQRSGNDTPARRVELFERTFGQKLPEIEARWREHVERIGEVTEMLPRRRP